MPKILVWFRNDLRTHDHEALSEALKRGDVLPVYCFDSRQFGNTSFGFTKTGPFRAKFLVESVQNLRKKVSEFGGQLLVVSGKPEEVLPEIIEAYVIEEVYAHKEITSEEVNVETALAEAIEVPLRLFWGSTLFHRDDLKYDQYSIPDVFTQFRKKTEKNSEVRKLIKLPEKKKFIEPKRRSAIPTLKELGVKEKEIDQRSVLGFKGGEDEALRRVQEYIWEDDLLKKYKYTRNGLLGADYSSKFSPWLANGSLSPRIIYSEVNKYEDERTSNVSTYWMIFELIWRDYFRFSAWKYGNDIFRKGGIQHKDRDWDTDREKFNKWAGGETGIPFIDANMRELNASGYMSNRGRQNVASFLAQNLNLDWRMGAEYFESLLIDYDPCSNYGNWAYNATVGHDPRNRYFNILNQADKYDRKGEYVRHWIPELKHVPDEYVHEPHTIPPEQQKLYELEVGIDYPEPIIDLGESYEEIRARD